MFTKIVPLPDLNKLNSLLAYDPMSGRLTWLHNNMDAGSKQKRRSGTYLIVGISKRTYLGHRIIWKMMTGFDPPALIDHKDRNTLNNKWENLRSAKNDENLRNAKLSSTNTSGIKGVTFDRQTKRWRAQIVVNYHNIRLGRFKELADAGKVIAEARQRLHGEFARSD